MRRDMRDMRDMSMHELEFCELEFCVISDAAMDLSVCNELELSHVFSQCRINVPSQFYGRMLCDACCVTCVRSD